MDNDTEEKFEPGDLVMHAIFGRGEVLDHKLAGLSGSFFGNGSLVIKFERGVGTKELQLAFARPKLTRLPSEREVVSKPTAAPRHVDTSALRELAESIRALPDSESEVNVTVSDPIIYRWLRVSSPVNVLPILDELDRLRKENAGLKAEEKDQGKLIGEHQNNIRARIVAAAKDADIEGADNIDGAGCDSGDWRDFTESEVGQGLSLFTERVSALLEVCEEFKGERDASEAELLKLQQEMNRVENAFGNCHALRGLSPDRKAARCREAIDILLPRCGYAPNSWPSKQG